MLVFGDNPERAAAQGSPQSGEMWRPNMRAIVGEHDIAMIVFDSLRFDTAVQALHGGQTPNLAQLLAPRGWERRESPGTFTLPAHLAFFHGFLPTPLGRHREPRLFALAFDGARTTDGQTCVFADREGATILDGLASRGYHTLCVGGVSFFNGKNPLGCVLPSLFAEAHWQPSFAHTQRHSARAQVDWCVERLAQVPTWQRLFLYVNVSATHTPHAHHLAGAPTDSVKSQRAALASVDRELPRLREALARKSGRPTFWILLGDHGDAYGDDGLWGHRHAHESVTNVPYAHMLA